MKKHHYGPRNWRKDIEAILRIIKTGYRSLKEEIIADYLPNQNGMTLISHGMGKHRFDLWIDGTEDASRRGEYFYVVEVADRACILHINYSYANTDRGLLVLAEGLIDLLSNLDYMIRKLCPSVMRCFNNKNRRRGASRIRYYSNGEIAIDMGQDRWATGVHPTVKR
jgi:hypothetical protein